MMSDNLPVPEGLAGLTSHGRGSRPPIEPGAEMGIRHGAMASRRRQPIAQELINGLYQSRPDLIGFPEAVEAWGHAEAACILYRTWLTDQGLLDHEGNPRNATTAWVKMEALAMQHRKTLGLDPRAEADLARSRADATAAVVDLDGLRDMGRRLREAAAEEAQEQEDAAGVVDGELL